MRWSNVGLTPSPGVALSTFSFGNHLFYSAASLQASSMVTYTLCFQRIARSTSRTACLHRGPLPLSLPPHRPREIQPPPYHPPSWTCHGTHDKSGARDGRSSGRMGRTQHGTSCHRRCRRGKGKQSCGWWTPEIYNDHVSNSQEWGR